MPWPDSISCPGRFRASSRCVGRGEVATAREDDRALDARVSIRDLVTKYREYLQLAQCGGRVA
jgi:hypothetical protein